MKNFHELELRTLVFLALAKLREIRALTKYFTANEIFDWICDQRDDYKTEKKTKRGHFDNFLSDIKKNKKTNSNKDGANTFVLRENTKEINRVEEIISVNARHKPHMYSLSDSSVENELSATVVLALSTQAVLFTTLPIKREKATVEVLYERFKDRYELAGADGVKNIIQSAENGLYFTRKDGKLKPTQRALVEELYFLEHLAPSLSEIIREVDAKVKAD